MLPVLLPLVASLLVATPEVRSRRPARGRSPRRQCWCPRTSPRCSTRPSRWNGRSVPSPPLQARLSLSELEPDIHRRAGASQERVRCRPLLEDGRAARRCRLHLHRAGALPAGAGAVAALAPHRRGGTADGAAGRELPAIADRCDLEAGLAQEDLNNDAVARRLFARIPAHLACLPRCALRALAGAAAAGRPCRRLRCTESRSCAAPAPLWGPRRGGRGAGHPGRPRPEPAATPRPNAGRCSALWSGHPRSLLGPGRAPAWAAPPSHPRRWWLEPRPRWSCTGTARGWTWSDRRHAPLAPRPAGLPRPLRGGAGRCASERRHTEAQEVLTPVVRALHRPRPARPGDVPPGTTSQVGGGAAAKAVKTVRRAGDRSTRRARWRTTRSSWPPISCAQDGEICTGRWSGWTASPTATPKGDQLGEALFKAFWLHHRWDDDAAGPAATSDRLERASAAGEEELRRRAGPLLARRGCSTGREGRPRREALWEAPGSEHPATYCGLLARRAAGRERDRGPRLARRRPRLAEPVAPRPPRRYGCRLRSWRTRTSVPARSCSGWASTTRRSSELLAARRAGQPADAPTAGGAGAGPHRRPPLGARGGPAVAPGRPGRTAEAPPTAPFWEIAYPDAFRRSRSSRYTRGSTVEPELLRR